MGRKTFECEILIVGAGIIGLTISRELLKKGISKIIVIEKEDSIGRHASGRNSGVLHAGIYYSPGTKKARYCVEGNKLLKEYCYEKGLTIKETGKIIVAKNESELERIYVLKKRADLAGAVSYVVDSDDAKELEPYAYTFEKALYSPNTALIDPAEILLTLQQELESCGKVEIMFATEFKNIISNTCALTNRGEIKFQWFVNAAGSFTDKIASKFNLAEEYRTIPFKGIYKKIRDEKSFYVKSNIYPVPKLEYPFLGVHLTRSVKNDVYAGPTAMPILGRENYSLLKGITTEAIEIMARTGLMFILNKEFRSLAIEELKKYSKLKFFEEANKLLPALKYEDLYNSSKVGIRPQLIHWPTKSLVTDFLVLKDNNSIHILNSISPAFTSSMAFSKYCVDYLFDDY